MGRGGADVFGYVRPRAAELKVKEYELYRAVYCGLCYSLGKCTGCASKLTLSYDFVFLALVRMSLSGEVGRIEHRRCAVHPMKKRSVLTDCSELDISARLSACLTYHKLRDDISDDSGIKRMTARILVPEARRMKKRAALERQLEDFVSDKLEVLAKLESEACGSLDEAAEPFGELLARVFAYGYEQGSVQERLALEMGRHIGRFVYIIDAIDDLENDIKRGRYNPLWEMDGRQPKELDTDGLRLALTMELSELSGAVEIMDFSEAREYGSIIKNIIYLGLPDVIEKTITKYSDKEDE